MLAIVCRALIGKGVRLADENEEGELACYEQVLSRFGQMSNPELQAPLAQAMLFKAITLSPQGKDKEARELLEETITRFSGNTDEAVRYVVAEAAKEIKKIPKQR